MSVHARSPKTGQLVLAGNTAALAPKRVGAPKEY